MNLVPNPLREGSATGGPPRSRYVSSNMAPSPSSSMDPGIAQLAPAHGDERPEPHSVHRRLARPDAGLG